MTEGGTTTTYTYDDCGRTISKTDGTYSATYLWLFGDKLKQYATDLPGEGDVAFNYDGLGKRRNKLNHVNGVYSDADWTWYRWDADWNMIGEYAAGTDTGTEWDAGALTRWYQGKAAHADGDPDSTAYNYYLRDHLGSPRATYNQSKAAIARLDFSAYGSPLTTAGVGMDVGYTGHKWDGEIGTFYAPFRYYAPEQARWVSRDPLGMVDGPNVYGYVTNSPSMYIDELGLQCCDRDALEACIVAARHARDRALKFNQRKFHACMAGAATACVVACVVVCAHFGPLAAPCVAKCVMSCSGPLAIGCRAYRDKRKSEIGNKYDDSVDNCLDKHCPAG